MANLEFCDKHNMVAYLKKPTGSEGFQEIVDFLNGSHIRFALTKNPTIYVSLIEKFWHTTTVKTVDNGEKEITTIVDGKEFTITKASIRRHLQLTDVEGMLAIQAEDGEGSGHPSEPQPPPSNAQPTYEEPIPNVVSSLSQKTQTPRQALQEDTQLSQTRPDFKEWDDIVVRATTTAASLDATHTSGNITKTQSTTIPNVPLPQGIGTGGSPRCQEAIRVSLLRLGLRSLGTDLKQTKQVYGAAYTKLIMKVKKLEKTVKSNQAKRREKIVVSDDEEDLEDSSKQGRMIEEIDQDAGITLVTPTKDTEEGEGSGHPSEPQPPPPNAQPTYEEPIPNVTSVPIPNVVDEAVFKEWNDRVVRATTTAANLDAEQASVPGAKKPWGSFAQTRSKRVPTPPYDSPLPRVNTFRSDEGNTSLQELTVLCTKLCKKVESLEADLKQIKKVYGAIYTKLIKKVKKLEKTLKSNQTRRRAKIVVSDDEEDLEDSSKQGRMIEEIDQDAGITLVTPTKDTKNVHIYTRRRRAVSIGSGGVSTASRLFSTAEESVSTAGASMPVSTAAMVQEVNIKDKATENIRARVEADEELTQRLQAEERNKYSEVDQAKMLVDLINQRKRYFAAQKAKAKRNKTITQAQQRNYMMNYIKHIGTAGSSQATIIDSAEVGISKRGAEVELDHEGSKKQETNEASESVQEQPDEKEKEFP
ncbi:hypothetical protein Tco_0526158 [Tanacetum coccineum]